MPAPLSPAVCLAVVDTLLAATPHPGDIRAFLPHLCRSIRRWPRDLRLRQARLALWVCLDDELDLAPLVHEARALAQAFPELDWPWGYLGQALAELEPDLAQACLCMACLCAPDAAAAQPWRALLCRYLPLSEQDLHLGAGLAFDLLDPDLA